MMGMQGWEGFWGGVDMELRSMGNTKLDGENI